MADEKELMEMEKDQLIKLMLNLQDEIEELTYNFKDVEKQLEDERENIDELYGIITQIQDIVRSF
jgi:hypothetical protein